MTYMPSRLSFDELNTLSNDELAEQLRQIHLEWNDGKEPTPRKRRSMDYREFFGDMYLDPEEKEKRIEMAGKLERVLLMLFVVLASHGGMTYGLTFTDVYRNIERRSWEVIEKYLEPDNGKYAEVKLSPRSRKALEDSIQDYIARQTRYVVDNTVDHIDDEYYTSEDRAAGIAENQVNAIENDVEMYEALDGGFTHKTWVTMHDNHVRSSHDDVDGTTIPIEEPFQVGGSELLFPGDDSLGADASELVNCRCTVEYMNEDNGSLVRAEEEVSRYGEGWGKESLEGTITRFNAVNLQTSEDGRKTTYSSEDGRYDIIYDNYGNYFRIADNSIVGRRKFVDTYGNNMSNITENGKQRGRSQSEYNRDTHFKNTD